ncbi:acyl-CoA carboxylase subunit epsilon [Streptomyces sp. 184]|uniref:acyl-CoA carboxylase subunit epsilon n=1 Tax=Streptomyces sp. 184 TaxID=1827526 RepID=UPI003892009A
MAEWVDGAVRVERGNADAEELAVLTVVLMSALADRGERLSGMAPEGSRRAFGAQWWRWDRVAAYRPPHSWQ